MGSEPFSRQVYQRLVVRRWMAIGGICAGWLAISLGPLWRHLSHVQTIFILFAGATACCFAMFRLGQQNLEGRTLDIRWLIASFVLLMLAFFVLYFRTAHPGGGSDREDALRAALWALHHHIYPYSLTTYLGNPITPLPGALLLAEPFFELGHPGLQNIVWMAALFLLCEFYFRYTTTSLLFLSIFLILSPPNLSDITAGGDYIVNIVYVLVALAFCLRSLRLHVMVQAAAFVFLGITISSRILYALTLVPLFIALIQRVSWKRAFTLYGIALSASLLVTAPVFSPHPASRLVAQLHQQSGKLRSLPVAVHAEYSLPLLAACVMCLAFYVRLDFAKLLLFVGIGNAIVLGPPIAALAISLKEPVYELDYLIVAILPICFWIFCRYEVLTTSPRSVARRRIPVATAV